MMPRCPRCGSDRVQARHTDFREAGIREYGCTSCGLREDRRTDEEGYEAFVARWTPATTALEKQP